MAADAAAAAPTNPENPEDVEHLSISDFVVEDKKGSPTKVADLVEGKKAVLVVNVASKCGFTGQYKGLQEMYEKFKEDGLEILAFPCNQFGKQEPGSNAEIQEFACERFKTTFPILGKVEVNGAGAAPLYKYLKKAKQGKVSNDVWWNFEKFLVVDGKPIQRYVSTTTPASIEKDIEKALGKTSK
ncbi:GPXMC1 [Symbiodinium sp. KB8]|nr:GPXMC1 [Symbiodinium sp. KB8]